jgi:hypothetical protein
MKELYRVLEEELGVRDFSKPFLIQRTLSSQRAKSCGRTPRDR